MECIFSALQGPLNLHCIRIRAAAVYVQCCTAGTLKLHWTHTPLRWGRCAIGCFNSFVKSKESLKLYKLSCLLKKLGPYGMILLINLPFKVLLDRNRRNLVKNTRFLNFFLRNCINLCRVIRSPVKVLPFCQEWLPSDQYKMLNNCLKLLFSVSVRTHLKYTVMMMLLLMCGDVPST